MDQQVNTEAGTLLEALKTLGRTVQLANDTLAKHKKLAESKLMDAMRMSDNDMSLFKAEIDRATLLLDSLHPAKKPEAFWAQVTGRSLAAKIQQKKWLFIEAKAKTVQIGETRWLRGTRIRAIGEVQVAYRLFKPDGTLEKSGVILRASEPSDMHLQSLKDLTYKVNETTPIVPLDQSPLRDAP